MGTLESIAAFHKARDRRSEITELSYHSCRQGHTYIIITLYKHTYVE